MDELTSTFVNESRDQLEAMEAGFQTTVKPLVRLKVLAEQKTAALRYHTW